MIKFTSITGYLINSTRKEIVKFTFLHPSINNNTFIYILGIPESIVDGFLNGKKAYELSGWGKNEHVKVTGYDDNESGEKFDLETYLNNSYVLK